MTTYTIHHGTTKPIRAVGKHQCNLLRFAERFRGWHTAGKDRATQRAVAALNARGCLEISGDQFRFAYPAYPVR